MATDDDGIHVLATGMGEQVRATLDNGAMIVEYANKPGMVGIRLGVLHPDGTEHWLTPMMPMNLAQAEDMRERLREQIQWAKERQS